MKKVFICSPYRGDTEGNVEKAGEYCRQAIGEGYLPIAPHLYFTQFLNDDDKKERNQGIMAGLEMLEMCDEVWVYGTAISEGMAREIAYSKLIGKPIIQQEEHNEEYSEENDNGEI